MQLEYRKFRIIMTNHFLVGAVSILQLFKLICQLSNTNSKQTTHTQFISQSVSRLLCPTPHIILHNQTLNNPIKNINLQRHVKQCRTWFKQITFSISCCQQSMPLSSFYVCSRLNHTRLVMHGQLVFLTLLYHIHWLIFSDSLFLYNCVSVTCFLCM